MKVLKIFSGISGGLMVLLGLYYLGIGYAIGVSMLLDAISTIHAWWQFRRAGEADGWLLAGGILSAVFGIILIADAAAQLTVDVFIAYMAAIWILTRAVITIIRAFRARRLHKTLHTRLVGKNWWLGLIIGVLMCVFAVLSLMNPAIIMSAIGMFLGLGVITVGAEMLTMAFTPAKLCTQDTIKKFEEVL